MDNKRLDKGLDKVENDLAGVGEAVNKVSSYTAKYNDLAKLDEVVSPWMPITDPVRLALFGKLGEELNEAGSAICRTIIQGTCGRNPKDGKLNIDWLQEEIADVQACINLVKDTFVMNGKTFDDRVNRKMEHLRKWHILILKAMHDGSHSKPQSPEGK